MLRYLPSFASLVSEQERDVKKTKLTCHWSYLTTLLTMTSRLLYFYLSYLNDY